mmetsp:Transcript_23778/g.36757  ORF Transcript_23778/g.36757 Transcript_23778/m.36757 type:complete len:124 (-) Transcript_23778:127-498(-)
MTKYDSIEADPEAIALTAKDEGDDIKVSCRANKFAVKVLTVVAVIAVVGVVAFRGMTASNTPKIANVDVDQLGTPFAPCNSPYECDFLEECCYTPFDPDFLLCVPRGFPEDDKKCPFQNPWGF